MLNQLRIAINLIGSDVRQNRIKIKQRGVTKDKMGD